MAKLGKGLFLEVALSFANYKTCRKFKINSHILKNKIKNYRIDKINKLQLPCIDKIILIVSRSIRIFNKNVSKDRILKHFYTEIPSDIRKLFK